MFNNQNICFPHPGRQRQSGSESDARKIRVVLGSLGSAPAKSGALVPAGWASLKREIGTKVGTNLLLFQRLGDGNSASRKHSGSQICRIRLKSVTGFLELIDSSALKCARILA